MHRHNQFLRQTYKNNEIQGNSRCIPRFKISHSVFDYEILFGKTTLRYGFFRTKKNKIFKIPGPETYYAFITVSTLTALN